MEKKNNATNFETLVAAAKGKTIMRVVFFRRAFQVEETGRLVECRDFANQLNFFLQTIGWKIQQETYHNEVRSAAGPTTRPSTGSSSFLKCSAAARNPTARRTSSPRNGRSFSMWFNFSERRDVSGA